MFISSQQKLSAMVILLSAMGTSATLSAAGESGVLLPDDQRSAPSAQLAMHQVSLQATNFQPMLNYDPAGTGATVAAIDTGMSEQRSHSETTVGFLGCD
jgi:hypothetical protein